MHTNVLIVDDDPVNLAVAAAIVKKLGCAVDLANSGQEALEKIKRCEYDLIILDHNMPGLSGYETASAIRNTEGAYFQNVRIVGCTSDEIIHVEEKALEAGMNKVINKPISIEKFRSLIENR